MSSKGRPYRTVEIEGYEVLVGRGAEDNEHLTFEVAERRDLWLHVAGGTPGSHVVIRDPGGAAIPRSVIEAAARLAAWYSKARGSRRVKVSYCRVADVRKERGAPRGQVLIRRHESIEVVPGKLDD